MVMPTAREAVLHVAKDLGLFKVAEWLYRKRLSILCYHGFSMDGEHEFRPKLFMTSETFARRLAYLKNNGYQVVTLHEALLRIEQRCSRIKDIVITIDDGFYSVLRKAAPLLKIYGFPATLYVTSYYVKHANPIFRLVVQYMFWRTCIAEISINGLFSDEDGVFQTKGVQGDSLCWRIIGYGEKHLDEAGRMKLLDDLGRRLGISLDNLRESRLLSLLSPHELDDIRSHGLNVQLHTHRHRSPESDSEFIEEIISNRDFLSPYCDAPLEHFCYPSGEWRERQWQVLAGAGVVSAMTCEAGLNSTATPHLALYRFLDSEEVSDIEFAAELSGFKQLLRDVRTFLTGRHRAGSRPPPADASINVRNFR